MGFDHRKIEAKWQKYWEDNQTFKTDVWDFSKPKFYALDMFPYPISKWCRFTRWSPRRLYRD